MTPKKKPASSNAKKTVSPAKPVQKPVAKVSSKAPASDTSHRRNSGDVRDVDPSDLRFTDTHEWVRVKDRNTIVVGITDFLQIRLSDVTSVELPEPDENIYEAGEEISVVEALSASATFHAPIAGSIVATNTDLLSRPELINNDPYGAGWLIEIKPVRMSDLEGLMNIDEYEVDLPEDEEE